MNELSSSVSSQPAKSSLSSLSTMELFNALQANITLHLETALSEQQTQYESQLRGCEGKIRAQHGLLCQLKLQREAMDKRLQSLSSKEEEYNSLRRSSSVMAQKENEIIILRAENSNLKSTLFKIEEKLEECHKKIECLEGQLLEYNDNPNNNININIKDISNSKVIIKTNSQYSPSATKKKKKPINLAESNSNRNVFFGHYRSVFLSNRTTQGSQCPTKGNSNPSLNKAINSATISNSTCHSTTNKDLIKKHGSFVNNTSRLWSAIQKDLRKVKKTKTLTNLLVSSLQNSHSHSNSNSSSAINKGVKAENKPPETFRSFPRSPKHKL